MDKKALGVIGQVEILAVGIGQSRELALGVVAGGDAVAVAVFDVIERTV